jgi:bifunctional polynucleotide phosphatase/kinase
MTPEEFFLGEPAVSPKQWEWDGCNPSDYLKSATLYQTVIPPNPRQELVILIGPPASGKSTFCAKHFPNHIRVNNDTLKTKAKCIKLATDSLKAGKSVVIDNTNPSAKVRKEYIDLAKGVITVRAIVLDTPKELALHLNEVRVKMTLGKTKKIPGLCYNMFCKNYEQPTQSEGITDVIVVPFIPEFENEQQKRTFLERT